MPLKVSKTPDSPKIPNLEELFPPEVLLALSKVCVADPEYPDTFTITAEDLLAVCRCQEKFFTVLALQFFDDPGLAKQIRKIRGQLFDLSQDLEARENKRFRVV